MTVPINYLAVLVAAVVSIILGMLWYGPWLGKQWIALMGMSPASLAEAKKKGLTKIYTLMP